MNIQSALVLSILKQWRSYEWTQQGFGFIRTKIENVGRIHIWDSCLTTPHVSTMHTHPWPLESTIISGELINCKFVHEDGRTVPFSVRPLRYIHQKIATGEGGGLLGEPQEVELYACQPETYTRGQTYSQAPSEIHRTLAQDGTVTLMTRPQGPPLEEADVYWPVGTTWVSAEPRPIPEREAQKVIERAIARWDAA